MTWAAVAIGGAAVISAGIGYASSRNTPDVTQAPPSAEQQQISALLTQYLDKYGGQMTGAVPTPTYTGQLTAGLSPLQTQSISNIGELQNLGQSQDTLSQIMNMVRGKNFDPSYMRQAYQTGIEDPLRKTFTETTMPALNSAYSKAGLFYGSDRGVATEKESQTLMDALAMGRAALESNIYTSGLANQQAGISDFSQFLSEQGGLAGQGMLAGQIQQATEQTGLTNEYNQWLRTQPGTMATDPLLQSILGMYSGVAPQNIVQPASQTGAITQNAMNQMLMGYLMSKK